MVEHATSLTPLNRGHAWSLLSHVNFALKRPFEIIGLLVVQITHILQFFILHFWVFIIDLYARCILIIGWIFRNYFLGRTVITILLYVVAEQHRRLLFSQLHNWYLVSVRTYGFRGLMFIIAVKNRYFSHRYSIIILALFFWVIVNV